MVRLQHGVLISGDAAWLWMGSALYGNTARELCVDASVDVVGWFYEALW